MFCFTFEQLKIMIFLCLNIHRNRKIDTDPMKTHTLGFLNLCFLVCLFADVEGMLNRGEARFSEQYFVPTTGIICMGF